MKCEVARCRRVSMLSYAAFASVSARAKTKDVQVCEFHWTKHCSSEDKFDLRTHFFPNANKKEK